MITFMSLSMSSLHSSKWMVAGVGEAGDSNSRDRTYCHPDSPFTGRALMSQAVSFERVKLTNSAHARPGQVSMTVCYFYLFYFIYIYFFLCMGAAMFVALVD